MLFAARFSKNFTGQNNRFEVKLDFEGYAKLWESSTTSTGEDEPIFDLQKLLETLFEFFHNLKKWKILRNQENL